MENKQNSIVNFYAKLSDYKQKRSKLLELAAKARHIQKEIEDKHGIAPNINTILLLKIYGGGHNLEWKSFNEWKKAGKRVRKGEKAWLVFSRPIKDLKRQAGASQEELDQIDDNWFGTRYVFNSQQVA